jgi:hypothetical protein
MRLAALFVKNIVVLDADFRRHKPVTDVAERRGLAIEKLGLGLA